jgi:hypothetical protein
MCVADSEWASVPLRTGAVGHRCLRLQVQMLPHRHRDVVGSDLHVLLVDPRPVAANPAGCLAVCRISGTSIVVGPLELLQTAHAVEPGAKGTCNGKVGGGRSAAN